MPLVNPREPAPAFALRDQQGKRHTLANYAGRVVVLYFYPEDDTSGCTDQACQFRDSLPEFSEVDAVVLGVSPDSEESHQKFVSKHELNFTLLADLADADGNPPVCERYGVWEEKSMYGRKYMGVVRTTYLIGRDGVVARRWDSVMVPGHAAEVLDAVVALNTRKSPVAIEVKPRKTAKAGTGTTKAAVKKKAASKPASSKLAAPVKKTTKSAAKAATRTAGKKASKKAGKKRTLVGAGARTGGAKASASRTKAKKATGKGKR